MYPENCYAQLGLNGSKENDRFIARPGDRWRRRVAARQSQIMWADPG